MYSKKNENRSFHMNLQLFADQGKGTDASGAEGDNQETNDTDQSQSAGGAYGEQGKPSYEELLEKLAQSETRATNAETEAKRMKAASDKASSEAANFKKQLMAKMTAQEQANAAEAEEKETRDREFNEMKVQLKTIEATKRYMTIKMTEEKAEETAKAEISGDMGKVISNISMHIKELEKAAGEEAINKFLIERPDIKAGNGNAEKLSLAEEKAKEFVSRKRSAINNEALKIFM